MFILDTDILSLYQHEHPIVVARVQACPKENRAIAVISVEEQLSGWYSLLRRARTPPKLAEAYERLAEAVMALSELRVFSFTEAAIAKYQQLLALKLQVRKYDLRIAAIALEHGATVVTRNLRDFQRVPGLTVEDWSI